MSSDKTSLLSANSIPARLSLRLSLLSQMFTLSPGKVLGHCLGLSFPKEPVTKRVR